MGTEEKVVLKWTQVLETDVYQIQVFPEGTNCLDPRAFCGFVNETVFKFTPKAEKYFVRVRAVNVRCGGVPIDEKDVEDLVSRGKARINVAKVMERERELARPSNVSKIDVNAQSCAEIKENMKKVVASMEYPVRRDPKLKVAAPKVGDKVSRFSDYVNISDEKLACVKSGLVEAGAKIIMEDRRGEGATIGYEVVVKGVKEEGAGVKGFLDNFANTLRSILR